MDSWSSIRKQIFEYFPAENATYFEYLFIYIQSLIINLHFEVLLAFTQPTSLAKALCVYYPHICTWRNPNLSKSL